MIAEAKETEERCTQLAEELDGKKTAVLEKARETKQEATEMMRTSSRVRRGGSRRLRVLVMAEAGEVGHWEVLRVLGQKAGKQDVQELVDWAILIQQRHFQDVREGSLKLASEEDPNAEARRS